MVLSGIPIEFYLHCISKGPDTYWKSPKDIKQYLINFNDYSSYKDATYSSDITIIVKKDIGKQKTRVDLGLL